MSRLRPSMLPFVVVLMLCLAGAVHAGPRMFVGARNLGMGNTGVGGSTDALSVHFNPAGMAFGQSWEVQLPLITVDADLEESNILSQIDAVSDIFSGKSLSRIQESLDSGNATVQDLETLFDAFLYALPELENGAAAASVRGLAGPAFRWKNWGISATILGNGDVDAKVDLANGLSLSSLDLNSAIPGTPDACDGDLFCLSFADDLISASGGTLGQAEAETLVAAAGSELEESQVAQEILARIVEATVSGDSTLGNNSTGLATTGWLAQQFAFTYARKVYQDKLSVGANIKVIRGETYVQTKIVAEIDSGSDFLDDLTGRDVTKSSTELTLDLGVMYRPTPKWSFGLSGTNLTGPSFELVGDLGEYKLDPLVRVGVAYRPLKWFNAALDVDLTEQDSALGIGSPYRYVNAGVEFLAGRWFSGWLGAYENIARGNAEPVLSAGVGFDIGRFQIALSGAASSDSIAIETDSRGEGADRFPKAAAVAVSLAWRNQKKR